MRLSSVATPELVRKFAGTFDSYWADPAFVPYDPDDPADVRRLRETLGRDRFGSAAPATVRPRGAPVPAPDPDPRGTRVGAHRSRPAPQPRRRGDRHRKDRRRRAGLRAAAQRPCRAIGCCSSPIAGRSSSSRGAPTARCWRDGTFGEEFVGGDAPGAVAARLRQCPVAGRLRRRADPARPLRRRGRRRVPPRRGADLPPPARSPGPARAARPDRHTRADRRRRRPGALRRPQRVRAAVVGRAGAPTCSCPSTTSAFTTTSTCAASSGSAARYDTAALDNVYTGNDARARKVVRETRRQGHRRPAGCGRSGSACRWRTRSTWPTCSTAPGSRASPCRRVRRRPSAPRRCGACGRGRSTACSRSTCSTRVVDLPQVDTVLFLRPTQSSTVFLQQLGRGLRRAPDKAVLTVLDFIGQHRREFRFDVRYRALTGGSRRALLRRSRARLPVPAVRVAARARPRRADDRPGERAADSSSPVRAPSSPTSGRTVTFRSPTTCASRAATSPTSTPSAGRGPRCVGTPDLPDAARGAGRGRLLRPHGGVRPRRRP